MTNVLNTCLNESKKMCRLYSGTVYGCQGPCPFPLPTLRDLKAPNMLGGKRDVENRAGGW